MLTTMENESFVSLNHVSTSPPLIFCPSEETFYPIDTKEVPTKPLPSSSSSSSSSSSTSSSSPPSLGNFLSGLMTYSPAATLKHLSLLCVSPASLNHPLPHRSSLLYTKIYVALH